MADSINALIWLASIGCLFWVALDATAFILERRHKTKKNHALPLDAPCGRPRRKTRGGG